MKYLIILTCCLNTNNCSGLQRKNFETRLNDYRKSFLSWKNKTDYNILIIENSNNGKYFSEFESDRIEVVTFDGNKFPRYLGKGYGERKSILYAINNTKKFSNIDKYFIITGRYFIHNMNDWIKELNDDIHIISKPIIKKSQGPKGIADWIYNDCFFMTKYALEKYYKNVEIDDTKIKYGEHALIETQKLILKELPNSVIHLKIKLKINPAYSGTKSRLYKNYLPGDNGEEDHLNVDLH
jgi:hypothetical protein